MEGLSLSREERKMQAIMRQFQKLERQQSREAGSTSKDGGSVNSHISTPQGSKPTTGKEKKKNLQGSSSSSSTSKKSSQDSPGVRRRRSSAADDEGNTAPFIGGVRGRSPSVSSSSSRSSKRARKEEPQSESSPILSWKKKAPPHLVLNQESPENSNSKKMRVMMKWRRDSASTTPGGTPDHTPITSPLSSPSGFADPFVRGSPAHGGGPNRFFNHQPRGDQHGQQGNNTGHNLYLRTQNNLGRPFMPSPGSTQVVNSPKKGLPPHIINSSWGLMPPMRPNYSPGTNLGPPPLTPTNDILSLSPMRGSLHGPPSSATLSSRQQQGPLSNGTAHPVLRNGKINTPVRESTSVKHFEKKGNFRGSSSIEPEESKDSKSTVEMIHSKTVAPLVKKKKLSLGDYLKKKSVTPEINAHNFVDIDIVEGIFKLSKIDTTINIIVHVTHCLFNDSLSSQTGPAPSRLGTPMGIQYVQR
eukprot:UC4_evm4s1370